MRENLLFLSHRIPYPPNKGDKIRSFHLLDHLSRKYSVHLGTFVDDEADWQYQDVLKKICGKCCLIPMNPRISKLQSLSGFVSGEALTLPYYRNRELQRWVDSTISELDITRIVVFSSAMAQYVEKHEDARRIMDFVDIDSDKWTQYAESKSWPLDAIYRREGKLLEKYERKIAGEFDASFFVSSQEAALFKRIVPEYAANTHFYCNGVDAGYFSPDRDYADPFPAGEKAIVFTGAMDYWPNIDAVKWFSEEIFPIVLGKIPDARFHIVGSNPAPAVSRLAALPGVMVTGRVADVRPYLAHAKVAVAPLRIARGIQNKVLEAMAMEKPVVASPQALEGIAENEGCLLGDSAEEFAAHVIHVLEGKMSFETGRSCILKNYDWEKNLAEFSSHLERGKQP